MTTFSGEVTQLESLVPALIARDQKSEKDLAAANDLVTELTKERDEAKANAADPDLLHRLDVQIAALTQFMTPTPVVTPDPPKTDTSTAEARPNSLAGTGRGILVPAALRWLHSAVCSSGEVPASPA